MAEEATVLVPVPVRLLGEVYELLGRRMAESKELKFSGVFEQRLVASESVKRYGEEVRDAVVAQRSFSASELGLLKRTLEPTSLARTLLDMCSNAPGEPVSFESVVSEAGLRPEQARGQIGAFTKNLKKLFHTPEWPVLVHYGTQGQATYIMPEGMARIWREL